jgi:hypothetical protein
MSAAQRIVLVLALVVTFAGIGAVAVPGADKCGPAIVEMWRESSGGRGLFGPGCQSPARRRVSSAAVIVVLAVAGGAVATRILRPTPRTP